MRFSSLEQFINKKLLSPLDCSVQWNEETEQLIFSALLYTASSLPTSIRSYIAKRAGTIFLPHQTSLHLRDNEVWLIQKVPFSAPLSTKASFIQFSHMAKRLADLLRELAAEELVSEFKFHLAE